MTKTLILIIILLLLGTDMKSSASVSTVQTQHHSVEAQDTVKTTDLSEEHAPRWAVKTNALYYAIGAFNVAGEYYWGNNYSANLAVVYSPYTLHQNYKFRLLIIEPEVRYWLKAHSVGHVFGVYGQLGYYNVAWNDNWRYQDREGMAPALGFGLSYGYAFSLSTRLRLELNVGVGYTHFRYDRFYNIPNGAHYDSAIKNYWGINKAGVCLSYVFNRKIR